MSFVAHRLLQTCRPVAQRIVQRRGMAGSQYSASAVKKNKYIEEWNGRREITTESFEMNFKDVPKLLIWVILFPFGIYTAVRTEFKQSGARRYQDIL